MNQALVIAFSLTVFFATAYAVGWACAELGDRATGRLATSTRFRAALTLAPVGVAGGLALSVLSPQAMLGRCHCVSHPHHLHLCLEHASFSWAVLAAGIAGVIWLALRLPSLVGICRDYVATAAWVSNLRIAQRVEIDGTLVEIVEGAEGHAWTVGVGRPRVVVCQALWSRLDDEERAAIVAHERAHLARRDPLTLVLVRIATSLFSAGPAERLLRGWRRSVELACDRLAASSLGDAGAVAAALVACGRLQSGGSTVRGAMAAASDDLELRVRALLDRDAEPIADGPHRGDLAHALTVTAALLLAVGLLAGHSAHHGLETLLSWVS